MGRRGPRSGAGLTVIEGGIEYDPQRRIEPPADMTETQKEIWREVVKTEATEFFNTAWKQFRLREYCEAAVGLRGVQKAINDFDMSWVKSKEGGRKYRELQKARTQDLQDMRAAARDLRLTSQSRFTPEAAATLSKHAYTNDKFPWEL
jgi:phage terminase small subunit